MATDLRLDHERRWLATRSSFKAGKAHLRAFGATVGNLRLDHERRWLANRSSGEPVVPLRGYAATVDILRLILGSLGLPSEARPKGERRMVDQTGIEPVTS